MGKKLAAYNSHGCITGYFDTIDSPAPDGVNTVDITDEQWQACLALPGYTVQDGKLVAPAPPSAAQLFGQAKQAQINLVYAACAKAITAGYVSSALSTEYEYGSQDTDQANLLSLAQAGQGGALWCANNTGEWSFAAHTAMQVNQVLADWVKYRQSQQSKYEMLVSQINAATTVSAVQAIIWA